MISKEFVERKLPDKNNAKSSSCARGIETNFFFFERERKTIGIKFENFIYFHDDPIIINDFEIDI